MRQVTGVVIEFNRKHVAFNTLAIWAFLLNHPDPRTKQLLLKPPSSHLSKEGA